ncbi:1453_t:CDS:2, partial [Rhizophagus irregularis]
PAIRKYGALNRLSTETYKTPHKSYVKIPYRLSNKKDVMRQLVNALFDNIDQKIKSLKKSENPSHSNFIEGSSQLISTLDTFLDTSSQESESDEFYIKIYNSVHLEDRHILKTTGEFQGKE